MINKDKLKVYGFKRTILFVDDEEINKTIFYNSFKNYFKDIVLVSSEEEALNIFMRPLHSNTILKNHSKAYV